MSGHGLTSRREQRYIQLSAELLMVGRDRRGESFVANRQLNGKKGVNPLEVDMRIDPKECRLHALTCERLAQRSTSPIAKGAYTELGKKWLKVAADLETNQAPLMRTPRPSSKGGSPNPY